MATFQEFKGYSDFVEKSWLAENQSIANIQSHQIIRKRRRSQNLTEENKRKSTYLQKTIEIDKIEFLKNDTSKNETTNIIKTKSSPLLSALYAINDLGAGFDFSINDKSENNSYSTVSFQNFKQEKITKFQQLIINILQTKHLLKKSAKNRFLHILKYSFRPSNPFIILWNCIKMILILHIFFSFPLQDAFGEEFQNTYMPQSLLFAELIFQILDILLRFNMGIYYRGDFVQDKIRIAQIYISNGLSVDLLALIAFSLHQFIPDNFFVNLLKYLFFLKFKQLRKFLKFLRQEIDPRNRYSSQISLTQLLLQVIMMAHIIAICWIWVGKYSASQFDETWMSGLDQKWSSIYLRAVYYACMTMTTVGYGDILPQNDYEYMACISIMLLSCGIFAYTLNTITQIFQNMNRNKKNYQRDLEMMNTYMIRKDVNNNTRRKVKNYLKALWMLQGNTPNLSILSQSLQKDILIQDKGKLVYNIPFLAGNFSNKFLNELLNYIEERNLQPQEVMILPNSVQMLYLGDVNISWGQSQVQRMNKRGQSFGIDSLFQTYNKQVKLKCNDFSTLYVILEEKFLKVIDGFPQDREFYLMVRDLVNVNFNYSLLKIECPLCFKKGHVMSKCPETFFVPCKSLKILKHNFSIRQMRSYYSRGQKHCHFKTLKNRFLLEEVAQANETNFKNSNADSMSASECSLSMASEVESEQSQQSWQVQDSGCEMNELPEKAKSTKTLKAQKINMISNKSQQELILTKFASEFKIKLNFDIDQIKEFKNYFPLFNFQQIFRQYNKLKWLTKYHSHRRGNQKSDKNRR